MPSDNALCLWAIFVSAWISGAVTGAMLSDAIRWKGTRDAE